MKITREEILQDLLAQEYERLCSASRYMPIDCIVDDSIDIEKIEREADMIYAEYLETGIYK